LVDARRGLEIGGHEGGDPKGEQRKLDAGGVGTGKKNTDLKLPADLKPSKGATPGTKPAPNTLSQPGAAAALSGRESSTTLALPKWEPAFRRGSRSEGPTPQGTGGSTGTGSARQHLDVPGTIQPWGQGPTLRSRQGSTIAPNTGKISTQPQLSLPALGNPAGTSPPSGTDTIDPGRTRFPLRRQGGNPFPDSGLGQPRTGAGPSVDANRIVNPPKPTSPSPAASGSTRTSNPPEDRRSRDSSRGKRKDSDDR
jgi:hypothetical protein